MYTCSSRKGKKWILTGLTKVSLS